ncbi:MAG: aminoglycoside phosphotransferase [Herbinix sp.]|jgi:uncharacterized protein (TIGR02172 family)|nr:aminoglycoside phosphotransferase [Herbinix sp.]
MGLGNLIGKGNTADIFEWEENKVIKLFVEGYPFDAVCKEYKNATAISHMEFNHPKVFGMVDCNERHGIIYEKIMGITLLQWMFQTGEAAQCGKILALEHKKMLVNSVEDLPSYKVNIKYNIQSWGVFSKEMKEKLCQLLEEMPEGTNLCHGDFHPGNIMLQEDRNIIIDWMNACSGHPNYDIARTTYLIEMSAVPKDLKELEGFEKVRKELTDAYLHEMNMERKDLVAWLILIMAQRMQDGCIEEEKQYIINQLRTFFHLT